MTSRERVAKDRAIREKQEARFLADVAKLQKRIAEGRLVQEVAIETTLLRQGVHTSWATVRDALSTHEISTVVLPTDSGAILKIRKGSAPEPEQLELYRLLAVPTELIRPTKTWIHLPTNGGRYSD